VGGGGSTVNDLLPVVPPEVVTETFCVPKVALEASVRVAVIVVEFTTVRPETEMPAPVGTLMVLPATKFVPVKVTGTAAPWAPDVGLMDVSTGAGGFTLNCTLEVVSPSVVTETLCAPKGALEETTNVAVTVVVLVTVTLFAVIPVPPKLIVAGVKKFVPVRVTGTLVPCTPAVGLMEVSAGGAWTVNGMALEVPPEVITETFCAPSAAPAEICNTAVMLVALATTTLAAVTPVPPKFTVAPVMKFVPVSVTLTLVPWAPMVALSEVSVGAGFFTASVKFCTKSAATPLWAVKVMG